MVIPGHGPIATYQHLSDYVDLLTTIRSRMVNLISRGATLEQIQAAGITKESETWGGDPTLLINGAYLSLTHKYLGPE